LPNIRKRLAHIFNNGAEVSIKQAGADVKAIITIHK
jgi:hypothetical protein